MSANSLEEMRPLIMTAFDKGLIRLDALRGYFDLVHSMGDFNQHASNIKLIVEIQKMLDCVRTPPNAPKFDSTNPNFERDDPQVSKRLRQVLVSIHKLTVKLRAVRDIVADPQTPEDTVLEKGQLAREVLRKLSQVTPPNKSDTVRKGHEGLKASSIQVAVPTSPPEERRASDVSSDTAEAHNVLDNEPQPVLDNQPTDLSNDDAASPPLPTPLDAPPAVPDEPEQPPLPPTPVDSTRSSPVARVKSTSKKERRASAPSGPASSGPSRATSNTSRKTRRRSSEKPLDASKPTLDRSHDSNRSVSDMVVSTHASSVRTALLKIAEIALRGAGLSTEVLSTLDVSDSTVDDARVLATLDEIEHAVSTTKQGLETHRRNSILTDTEREKARRRSALIQHINDGGSDYFGTAWPFDTPHTPEKVLWIFETIEAQTGETPKSTKEDSGSALRLLARRTSKLKSVAKPDDVPTSKQIRVLKAVTLDKLIDLVLPSQPPVNPEELEIPNLFAVTFETFAAPKNDEQFDGPTLLSLVLLRYRGPAKSSPLRKPFETKKLQIRNEVGNFFLTWMTYNPHCFYADDGFLAKAATSFLAQAVEAKHAPTSMKDALDLLAKQRMVLSVVPPVRTGTSTTESMGDIDVVALAKEWCVAEYELLRAIAPVEFHKQAWSKKDKEQRAPNMLQYIEWFNQMSRWVATKILQGETAEQRALIIARFIETGVQLKKMRNYNGLMEILSALNGSAIFRLKRSWRHVPADHVTWFEELNALMNPNRNYKNYRKTLSKAQTDGATYLSFVGVVHTDLTFTDDANEDYTADGRINFEKVALVGRAIVSVFDGLKQPYPHASVKAMRHYLLGGDVWDENELYRISSLKEARLTAQEEAESRVKRSNKIGALAEGSLAQRRGVDTLEHNMQEKDWQVIMAFGELRKVSIGDVIFQPGQALSTWLRIKAGELAAEVLLDNQFRRVKAFSDGALCGHAEALLAPIVSNESLFRVVASAPTELWEVQRQGVLSLLAGDDRLAGRFWKFVAQNLAEHLKKLPFKREEAIAAASTPSARVATDEDTTSVKKVKRQANRSTSELLNASALAAHHCQINSRLNQKGQLFIFKTRLVLLTSLFGVTRQRKVLLSNVSLIECDEKDEKITLWTDDTDQISFSKFPKGTKPSAVFSMIKALHDTQRNENVDEDPSEAGATDDRDVLTSDDWEMLTKGAKRVKYPMNEVVIREGEVYQRLYQIVSGVCRVEGKGPDGQPVVLGSMTEGAVMGDISFLQTKKQGGATATVIADDDDVELVVVEGYFINTAIEVRPGFAGRFFRYLAAIIAERIQSRETLLYE